MIWQPLSRYFRVASSGPRLCAHEVAASRMTRAMRIVMARLFPASGMETLTA